MVRIRAVINAKIPKPNRNVTMTVGNKTVVDPVFADTGLDVFLDSLKRSQGESVSNEVKALVSNSAEMTGISVSRLDRVLNDDIIRTEYGLGNADVKSVYRTVERIGKNSDAIVSYLGDKVKQSYGVGMDTVFMDWTSMYFEAPQKNIVRIGYSRDSRPDRPQVTVGLSTDRDSGPPIGLTVMPGNILDVTHFKESFAQIRHLLPEDAMIVFDNGAYSMENASVLDREGIGFVTRLQLNKTDDEYVIKHQADWNYLREGIFRMSKGGNKGRKRYIMLNPKLRDDILIRYRRKAERDYDDMVNMKSALTENKKPRKKYRNSNCFVDTHLSYQFPLDFCSREEAIEGAVKRMTTGREGIFVLISNRELTAEEILGYYRERNAIETAFRDLKHGIDWRPARCTSEYAIKGRILLSFLALFCMSMIRFLYPEFRTMTAESISEELCSFSLTVFFRKNGEMRRVWSNYGPIIRTLWGRERPVPVPKASGQAVLDTFAA